VTGAVFSPQNDLEKTFARRAGRALLLAFNPSWRPIAPPRDEEDD